MIFDSSLGKNKPEAEMVSPTGRDDMAEYKRHVEDMPGTSRLKHKQRA